MKRRGLGVLQEERDVRDAQAAVLQQGAGSGLWPAVKTSACWWLVTAAADMRKDQSFNDPAASSASSSRFNSNA